MSRLIVKNLPLDITDAELRGVFAKLGRVTDCSLRFTNNGKFRGFAFIGYENEDIATKALTYFDNSFVRTSKIHVEKCRNLFEHHSATQGGKQSALKRKSEVQEPAVRKKRKDESQIDDLIEKETANDERLAEFLNLHESGPIWADDDGVTKNAGRSAAKSKQQKSTKSSEPQISEHVEESNEDADTGAESQRTLSAEQARIAEKIAESGRLFVRNLPYEGVSEIDLETLFSRFGQVVELELPRDAASHRLKGFALITFLFAEHALEAFRALDGTVFRGRLLHVLAGEPRRTRLPEADGAERNLKAERVAAKREAESRATSGATRSWNALFLGTDAVVERTSAELGISKRDLLLGGGASDSAAVRVALGETQLVQETRELLERHGVVLGCFDTPANPSQRSRTTLLVKNLQPGVDEPQLHALLSRFGPLCRLVLPPRALTAIAEFTNETDARRAFRSLAYTKLKDAPLFLEFAPAGIFNAPPPQLKPDTQQQPQTVPEASVKQTGVPESQGCSVLVRNVSFDTEEDALRRLCEKCGAVRTVTIARKAHFNPTKKSNTVELLSLGYAFVEYATPRAAQRALRELQATELDGHKLELRLAERAGGQPSSTQAPADSAAQELKAQKDTAKNKDMGEKDQRTKLVVRNVPFTANVAEIRSLFAVFGELVRVSLPKRVAPARAGSADSPHRGFAFVQFATHADARRALEALRASTHLYGRRLVLDWAADAAAPQPV